MADVIGEFCALLEAAARELTAAAKEVPPGAGTAAALAEVHEAARALAEAAVEAERPPCDLEKEEEDDFEQPPPLPSPGRRSPPWEEPEPIVGEVAKAALQLRAEAARARDVAEAALLALQDERETLIVRVHALTAERASRLEKRLAAREVSAADEDLLRGACEELEARAKALQGDVDGKSRRLLNLGGQCHTLGLGQRKLQRKHDNTLGENSVARKILALQHDTEAHLRFVNERCGEVDNTVVTARRECAERMEKNRVEWAEEQARCEDETVTLEAKLVEVELEYEARWRATEAERQLTAGERALAAAEAQARLEQQVAEIDAKRLAEHAASREQVELQHRLFEEARERALQEMEASLSQERARLEDIADAEARKCQKARDGQIRRVGELASEVDRYQENIRTVRASYAAGRRRVGHTSRPCSSATMYSTIAS